MLSNFTVYEQTKNSHMFKDKGVPCDLREKRKEIRICDTSHFSIFFWSYQTDFLQLLSNCEVHDIPHLPSEF